MTMRFGRVSLYALLCLTAGAASADKGTWSGSAGLEWRGFPDAPARGPGYDGAGSLYIDASYYRDFADGNQRIVIHPFGRIDQQDAKRTHADMREAYWEYVGDAWELRAGLRTLRWGVTESQHLVDIVNQTDLVEDPDGEDKLGQPMLDGAYVASWGTLQLFFMPYFRERTFVGKEGRPRSRWPIDTNDATFESGAEEWHPDLAIRYSHSAGPWDIGLSHFHGTSREPLLKTDFRLFGGTKYVPHYDIIDQTGIDLQYTRGLWIGRLEAIRRSGQGETFHAATLGVEYSFRGVGLLAEWLLDDRGNDAPTPFENDIYLGVHVFLSDEFATDIRAGATIDPGDGATRLSFEASRGLGAGYRLHVDAEIWVGPEVNVSGWHGQGDRVIRLGIARYF